MPTHRDSRFPGTQRHARSSGRHRSAHSAPAWLPSAFAGPVRTTASFYILLALLAVCALGGGSSFANVPSLLYVRPLAVVALIATLLAPAPTDWRRLRVPILLFLLFAGLIALQLVPLPPAIWTALPGRAPYVAAAALAGIEQPWRPLSLTPDLTANSLAALAIPAAVLAGFARLRDDQRRAMVVALVVLCCLSAALGVAQFAGGTDSPFYLYRRTYEGYTVGFLANRNHHATLLALVFPALRVWTLRPSDNRAWMRQRRWIALGLGVLILPVILATGSRAGMALTVLTIVGTFLLFPARRGAAAPPARRFARIGYAVVPLALVALVAFTYFSGRAASIERLFALSDVNDDLRFRFMPVMRGIIDATFPGGTGFGSFDPVFRQYEPDQILKNTYFNHAHNELIELTIMAGLPGLLLLGGFVLWWAAQSIATLRGGGEPGTGRAMVRLGAVVIGVILLASLVDYPLRAPLMAYVFTVGCCWLCERRTDATTPKEYDRVA